MYNSNNYKLIRDMTETPENTAYNFFFFFRETVAGPVMASQ
jgi:hypothetical protein